MQKNAAASDFFGFYAGSRGRNVDIQGESRLRDGNTAMPEIWDGAIRSFVPLRRYFPRLPRFCFRRGGALQAGADASSAEKQVLDEYFKPYGNQNGAPEYFNPPLRPAAYP